jgi:hypothetical protein
LITVGDRVYLYGSRALTSFSTLAAGTTAPYILHYDPHEAGPQKWKQDFDPKWRTTGPDADPQVTGMLQSLSIAPSPEDGTLTGWGTGDFVPPGGATDPTGGAGGLNKVANGNGDSPLIRLNPVTKKWDLYPTAGAAAEYLLPHTVNQRAASLVEQQVVALPGAKGNGPAFATGNTAAGRAMHPMVWFNPPHGRWEVFPTPFASAYGVADLPQQGVVAGMTQDNRGGFWLAARGLVGSASWFYHYTDKVRAAVFDDVPHPIREPITATATGGDASFWVATASGKVYRYDRVAGWDQVALKGWDAGGAVQSPAHAIAIGPDGEGLVVGKQGRIADVGPTGAILDIAAGKDCTANAPPCGSGGRTLRAAAIASDGSAMVGGDARTLRWRTKGGDFQALSVPDMPASATITGISMSAPNQAWLTTDTGEVFAGTLQGTEWTWSEEARRPNGDLLSLDETRAPLPLRSVAVDASGHGFAVGDGGVVLEHGGDGWRRLVTGFADDLKTVSLGPGGKGALVGGSGGLLLTWVDGRFEVARPSDRFDPLTAADGGAAALGGVIGTALLPGSNAGQVEAWAALQLPPSAGGRSPAPGALLHYTSDPSDPLLAAGAGHATPLPDAPDRDPGEIAIAAFGKTDCQLVTNGEVCPEFTGSGMTNEVVARRVRDAVVTRLREPDTSGFAVFTGDANDAAGSREPNVASVPTDASVIHERWQELMARPFSDLKVPLYGAIGGQDLSHTQACDPVFHNQCAGTHASHAGLNLAWRQAFASESKPWGSAPAESDAGLTFEEVGNVPATNARTHYAVDVKRGGKPILRLVTVDSSLKTLAGTAGVQNPAEDQLTWLEQVLSSRFPKERAVVVTETPPYSYGPGQATDTLADQVAFETLMVKERVDAVVAGRLGWNGLYWLAAPGLHSPCPGGEYQDKPPTDPTQLCQASNNDALANADKLAATAQGLGAPTKSTPSEVVRSLAGPLAGIPVAVAASAGGKFGPNGSDNGSGAQGYWRGYTLLRLSPDGTHPPTIEQRPVFDWIGLQANEHTLLPGHRLKLQGFGREPVGIDQPMRYDEISGPAITHHFDLVLADPAKPYLPKVDAASSEPHNYVSVPADIGATIDSQTGELTYSGSGNHPPVYALAILSVGDRAATWPVVLAPRRSFQPPAPPPLQRLVIPSPRVRPAVPTSLPNPPVSPIPKPPQLNLSFPPPPQLPSLSLNAPQTRPPAPPAPPPPPASPAATALQITAAPVGLNVAPPATVIPPPAPPIQPAPPSGARREARQRQAAVAKSEEGSGEAGASTQDAQSSDGGDSSAATRLDQRRDLAFTQIAHHQQPSAWPRDLLYGGGLTVAALALALGWGIARPTPRRREPRLPAPAWSRTRNRTR